MNIKRSYDIIVGTTMALMLSLGTACGASKSHNADSDESGEETVAEVPRFSADSAYAYVSKQVEFGPRVPNTPAHEKARQWLVNELKRHGAEVHEQNTDLTAFDGTVLKTGNVFGRFNPEKSDGRLLLLAHYDTRPWADQDPDESKRRTPADGANDGASGVGVLLEIARQFALNRPGRGVDILFVDSEDYGEDNNDLSWALGARYFAENMRSLGWTPSKAILLDMVGGKGARFPFEYFSRQNAPELDRAFRNAAKEAGFASTFPETYGGAVTDDHLELLKQGVEAIDIIEYVPERGFNATWHTHEDNMENIDSATLGAVGQSLMQFIYAGYGN